MSYNNRNNYNNNYNRSYNNYNNNNSYHNNDRQRSRQHNRGYNNNNNNRNFSNDSRFNSNNFNNNRNRFNNNFVNNKNEQYSNSVKVIRQVEHVEIGNPKVYLLWKHPKANKQQQTGSMKANKNNKITWLPNLTKKPQPAKNIYSTQSTRLAQLKNQITPVQQIWGQVVKQYLNDTQFVQIYRKKNSLAYDQIQYGKSIIKYDGLEQKQYYDNTNSQYNIFSRAYFKLWEILSLGVLKEKRQQDINIANLAQGPGGFIHSLIDFRLKQNKTLQDRYFAITLKIQEGKTRQAKDWSDFRGQKFFQQMKRQGYKIKLSYGQSGDGNLYDIRNIESFKTHVMEGKEAFLVTGDGGIQCIGDDQFHYQELFNAKLFFSQILTAFRIQQKGGTFILKIYDIHFGLTQQLLMLLCVYYRKVGIIKPLTSRPGNSQKYVLCQQFFGIQPQQLHTLTNILRQWHKTQSKLSYFQNTEYIHSILKFQSPPKQTSLEQTQQFQPTVKYRINLINNYLSKQQQTKIQQGLQLIKRHNGSKASIKKQIKQQRFNYQLGYAYQWCKKYGLKAIDLKQKAKEQSKK